MKPPAKECHEGQRVVCLDTVGINVQDDITILGARDAHLATAEHRASEILG
jgi:hypothetical protein